jgi:CheY-like chemotaxis protein
MHRAPISLLLADDDFDDCDLFKEALSELSIATSIMIVNDGEQLMRLLSEISDNLPDVLFLDLNFPKKAGFDCLAAIKRDEQLKSLCVVIFSTSVDERLAEDLFQHGAHYYICKPAEFSTLKKLILQILRIIESGNLQRPEFEQFILRE